MDVEPPSPRAPPSTGARAPASPTGESAASPFPPPRLPSISALLNTTSSEPTGSSPHLLSHLAPYGGFEGSSGTGGAHLLVAGEVREGGSPNSSQPRPPAPTDYPPVFTASTESAASAGLAFSQTRRLVRPAQPEQHRLASLEFPDGNALHPLPSGLSSDRPRAASISHAPRYETSAYSRFSGFATSSERGGGIEEAGDSADESARLPRGGPPHFAPDPLRPRAISIATTDEYRSHLLRAGPSSRPAFERPPLAHNRLDAAQAAAMASYGLGAPPQYVFADGAASGPTISATPHPAAPAPEWPPRTHAAPAPTAYPRHPGTGFPPPRAAYGTSAHQDDLPHLVPLAIPSGLTLSSPTSPPSSGSASHAPMRALAAATTPQSAISPVDRQQLNGPPAAAVPAAAGDLSQDAGRYGCPHCPKRFARPSSLRIHMHSHTGEKPFTCPLCDRAFSVQSNLRRHLKIHKGGSGAATSAAGLSAPDTDAGSVSPTGREPASTPTSSLKSGLVGHDGGIVAPTPVAEQAESDALLAAGLPSASLELLQHDEHGGGGRSTIQEVAEEDEAMIDATRQ